MSSPTSGKIRPDASTKCQVMSHRLDLGVVASGIAGHVLELAKDLDAGVPPADDDEGEHPAAQCLVTRGLRDVQALDDLVAQRDGLLDGLEPGAALGQARDRERPRDRAGGDDDVLVREVVRRPLQWLDLRALALVVDRGDVPADDLGPLEQTPAQGDDDVARLDGSCRGLGQERLVGHVRVRVDDGDHAPRRTSAS